jgi:DNA-binding MltR family transcriptional regulator
VTRSTGLLVELELELERLDNRATAGREAALRNETLRAFWGRVQRSEAGGPRMLRGSLDRRLHAAGDQRISRRALWVSLILINILRRHKGHGLMTRRPLHELIESVGALSQSATVLVACAVLDTELERALKADMRPASKAIYSRLFNGPLGTLSSKVDLAYLLGITTEDVHHNLSRIKEIRNKFAHTSVVLTLDSDIVQKYFKELKRPSMAKKPNTDIFIECADEVVSFLEAYLKRKGIPDDLSRMAHATLSKL